MRICFICILNSSFIIELSANVAILAKTTEPHPKLPGTIYTAAEEVEKGFLTSSSLIWNRNEIIYQKAGGNALPIKCDIRSEQEVQSAIDQTVATFGTIDILVNNASAISLTETIKHILYSYLSVLTL